MFPLPLYSMAEETLRQLRQRGQRVGTVESCTGGLIGALLTEVPGSSDVVAGGLITYSNTLKTALADVPETLLVAHGAVSEPVARAMAEGGRVALGVEWCIAVTGVAGPGGGSAHKPVGTVHLSVAGASRTLHQHAVFAGDRTAIRLATAQAALEMLQQALAAD